jgi:hypothetical protein
MDNAVGLTAHTAPFDWRDLYLQALFETERSRMYSRIAEAERALVRREHELFADSNGKAEREAVINALNALYALRTCLGLDCTAAAA